MDAIRIAPGVDHRRARPGALAEQIDLLVAERTPGRVEVIDAFGERVAGEVDAVSPKARARSLERDGGRAVRRLAEEIACMLARRHDLPAVEPLDDPSMPRKPTRTTSCRAANRLASVKLMFVIPGPPWSRKIGKARVRRARPDPRHRQRDQTRVRLVPVLAHDQRAAVGASSCRPPSRSGRSGASADPHVRRSEPRPSRRPSRNADTQGRASPRR